MPREDISFRATDGATLRGWFYLPLKALATGKCPAVVLSHGFSAVKEQLLDDYAESFQKELPALAVLVYDQRGFGASDAGPNGIRLEINPSEQVSDLRDAITYVQMRPEVDMDQVAIWGTSLSGGNVLQVAALDRRVKAVICQVPFVDGLETVRRLVKADSGIEALFLQDRHERAKGNEPVYIPVCASDPTAQAALAHKDAFDFYTKHDPSVPNSTWQNKISLRTMELLPTLRPTLMMEVISPTPLLMVAAEKDTLTPTDLALQAYAKAREPKELLIVKGDHFDPYFGKSLQTMKKKEIEFLRKVFFSPE